MLNLTTEANRQENNILSHVIDSGENKHIHTIIILFFHMVHAYKHKYRNTANI